MAAGATILYSVMVDAYVLPPLYTAWLAEWLPGTVRGEPRSTCSDCSMCRKMVPETPSDVYFNPAVKCCSFMPTLPNFLVGAILKDQSPDFADRRAQFEREAEKVVITPLGIRAPASYQWLHDIKTFGKSDILRCPYYRDEQGGSCSIWEYRNAVCSTWFCKFERGRTGYEFWASVKALLTALENTLSFHFALQLGADPQADAALDAAWGPWAGRARDFYRECSNRVVPLRWSRLMEIGGPEVRKLADACASAFASLGRAEVPGNLRIGAIRSEALGNGSLRVWGYSRYDPLDLGPDTAAALSELEKNPGAAVNLPPSVVQELIDKGIVLPADKD